jgi:hypothetical protein
MTMLVEAGALASSHISSVLPRMVLVYVSEPLSFVPLWLLALPLGSCHTFHSGGLCTGRTLRIVLRRFALVGFGVGSALG